MTQSDVRCWESRTEVSASRSALGSAGRWPGLGSGVFAAALLLYAMAMPLGLARVASAPYVAAAVARAGRQAAVIPVFAARLVELAPVGDVGLRANLTSCVEMALAMSLLARLAVEVLAILRPPLRARRGRAMFLHEAIAAVASALVGSLSLGVFEAGTNAGPSAAILLLLLGAFWAELALLRDVRSVSAGLVLASFAGLATGAAPAVAPIIWPILLWLAIWALRKGARWPVLALICFFATSGAFLLAGRAGSLPIATAGSLLPSLPAGPGERALVMAGVAEVADQVGVVGTILAGVGLVAILGRASLVMFWLLLNLITCLAAARLPAAGGRAGLLAAIAIVCVLTCVGAAHVSARLGRARLAAACALAVMLVLSPALDGGSLRFGGRLAPMHLLDLALARSEIGARVQPGTAELGGLLDLGRAIGLRPDLDIADIPDIAALPPTRP
ncbi:MAG: hypothetical protein ABSB49_17065 [Polyangia bacterium]